MEHIRSLNDMPPDVLCHILRYCCDGDVYQLDLLRPLSRSFRASVAMSCSSLAIADMREICEPGLEKLTLGTADLIKGTLKRCPRLLGLLLSSCGYQYIPHLGKLFIAHPTALCILKLQGCCLRHQDLVALGALPNLEALSLQESKFSRCEYRPWKGFSQLKMLRVDGISNLTCEALNTFRSQLLYLSCFNCMGIIGSMCDGLDNCIVLDMGQTYVSEGALQTLLDKGAPCLKLLLLTEYSRLPPAMTERMQEKGIKVVKSPYKADASAVEGYLQEALRDSPKLLKYAKHILC